MYVCDDQRTVPTQPTVVLGCNIALIPVKCRVATPSTFEKDLGLVVSDIASKEDSLEGH